MPLPRGDPGGQDDAAGRAGFDQPDRESARRFPAWSGRRPRSSAAAGGEPGIVEPMAQFSRYRAISGWT